MCPSKESILKISILKLWDWKIVFDQHFNWGVNTFTNQITFRQCNFNVISAPFFVCKIRWSVTMIWNFNVQNHDLVQCICTIILLHFPDFAEYVLITHVTFKFFKGKVNFHVFSSWSFKKSIYGVIVNV